MAKVALYDVDSKIPNLALMKLAAHYKENGDDVSRYVPLLKSTYDKIYASRLFNFSDATQLDPEQMEIGGSGYDLQKTLPAIRSQALRSGTVLPLLPSLKQII